MTKIALTEQEARDIWYKEAKEQTVDSLPNFINGLFNEYELDYGTICIALAAGAAAAAWASNKNPKQGGITGFQAGAITWEFIRAWNPHMIGSAGARIIKYEDMLYPQYEKYFTEQIISSEIWEKLKELATQKLADTADEYTHDSVIAHWKSIVDGNVPFGYKVSY